MRWIMTGGEGWQRFPYRGIMIVERTDDDLAGPFNEAIRWCSDQFGQDSERWCTAPGFDFYFRDQVDAVAFKIRWG